MIVGFVRHCVVGMGICTFVGSALGQTCVWNNEAGRFGTAAGHNTDPHWSLLDDLWFNQTVIVTDFSMLFIWSEGGVGRGERVDLTFWSNGADQPDEPLLFPQALSYREDCTGEVIFSSELLVIHQQIEALVVDPGIYWLEMHEVSSELGFQLMTEVVGQPGWTCYENLPPCPRTGREVFGFDTGFSFQLFGFFPDQATDSFIRSIQPLLFSGEPQGGVEEIRESDDEYYVLTASDSGLRIRRAQTALVVFETTLPALPIARLDLRVESTTNRPAVRQEIALFDFDADRWAVLDDRALPRSGGDTVVTLESVPNPARFINDADGRTRIRLDAYAPSVSVIPHQLKVDELKLIVTYAMP